MITFQWIEGIWSFFLETHKGMWEWFDAIWDFVFGILPGWFGSQQELVQWLLLIGYLVMGAWMAVQHERQYGREHPAHILWRIPRVVFMMAVWGPVMVLGTAVAASLFLMSFFYGAWLAYGGIIALAILFYGLLIEGGWKLITLPFS